VKVLAFLLAFIVLVFPAIGRDKNLCDVCAQPLGYTIYTTTDKVTHEKVFLCYECAICPDECYICGLPVRANGTKLADGRILCARDGKTAILDDAKAHEICETIKETLDRKLSRFLNLPSTNVEVNLVDRVNLYDEFAVVGNNFECPDVLGFIHSHTNGSSWVHSISMMSALPLAEFQATCAHEYMHAWVFENVSSERRKALSRDAHEGFCELIAYLLMDSLHEQEQMARMLRNSYTRGQIDLFIAAEKEFGLNDILDWMRWGVNGRLRATDLADIRNVEMPRLVSRQASDAPAYGRAPKQAPAPTNLTLKGISFGGNKPMALINDQTFGVGDSAKVRMGTTNVLVRCLAIGTHSVNIQFVDSGQTTELRLPAGALR
jgi:hypothetical protein